MTNKIAKYSTLAVPYSIFVSSFYLYGYWDAFEIDFYSYINVQEIAIRSIVPLAHVGIGSFFGFFTNGNRSESGTKLSRLDILIIILGFVVCLYVITCYSAYRHIAYSIISILCIALFFKFTNNKILNYKHIFYLLIFLPVLSFYYGKTESELIINGANYKNVIFHDIETAIIYKEIKELRYIGKISEYIFLYIPEKKETLVLNYNDSTPLIITKNR